VFAQTIRRRRDFRGHPGRAPDRLTCFVHRLLSVGRCHYLRTVHLRRYTVSPYTLRRKYRASRRTAHGLTGASRLPARVIHRITRFASEKDRPKSMYYSWDGPAFCGSQFAGLLNYYRFAVDQFEQNCFVLRSNRGVARLSVAQRAASRTPLRF
jgi:hypothetical protein